MVNSLLSAMKTAGTSTLLLRADWSGFDYKSANLLTSKDCALAVHTNKMKHFSFKRGCTVWITKCLQEDWLVKLQ